MLPNEILLFFAEVIKSETGIVFSEVNFYQLQNRLEDICKLTGVVGLEQLYAAAVKDGVYGSFKDLLMDLATNNETSFFRDTKVYKNIENVIIPSLCEANGTSKEIRIWSAASSSGQEAVSVAILLKEYSEKIQTDLPFSIIGTDISKRVVARAKEGQYSQLEVQRGLPAMMLVKYFEKNIHEMWQVSPQIQKHFKFNFFNLKSPYLFAEKFDLILCRNMLIYHDIASKIDIVNRLTACLADGGYLVLGAGESLIGISSEYDQVIADQSVFYRKKSRASLAS